MISPSFRPDAPRDRERLGGIREEQTGTRKSGAVIVQQSLGRGRRQLELRDHAGEQLSPWCIPIAITLDQGLNVLLLVYGPEHVSKTFPLTSNEPLETSTTVKQGSVEIEDHRLYIR